MDVLVVIGTTASHVYSACALLYGVFTGFYPPLYFETSAMIITFLLFGKYLVVLAKGETSDAIKKLVELAPTTALLLLKDKGLSQMVSLVETAQMSKAPIQKFADYVASIFVPIVIILSLLTFFYGYYECSCFVFSLMFSISVVVIACPYALGLTTPTAVMVATAVGLNENAPWRKATATTTKTFSGMDLGDFLTLVASAEASSEHPLAKSILHYAFHFHFFGKLPSSKDSIKNRKEEIFSQWLLDVADFSALPGKVIQCWVYGKKILVGNHTLIAENGINVPEEAKNFLVDMELNAKTGILVAYDGEFIAMIGITDPLKRGAAVFVEGLKKMGVHPVMVTGDNRRTAQAVAKEVGIEDVRAEVMPAGKGDVIRSLQKDGSVVAMVGDGINDSPALAAADYVLVRNNLKDVITAIDLSRKTFSWIRWNYFFSMVYNVVAIPVAAGALFPFTGVQMPPWLAGACTAFSSVRVVCSSLLLRRYRKPRLTALLQITVVKFHFVAFCCVCLLEM
ncbi:hypothetical protein EJB05_24504 [Eragrostis curvula]|uniref:HMA domain-containing protein n=1 Tax=Eragrostis curvula TaxID=38414 RepID=A0A5J9VAT4_9POAL|nr:hypothetical protein EJB05_24504 [Eragrostis curvula]